LTPAVRRCRDNHPVEQYGPGAGGHADLAVVVAGRVGAAVRRGAGAGVGVDRVDAGTPIELDRQQRTRVLELHIEQGIVDVLVIPEPRAEVERERLAGVRLRATAGPLVAVLVDTETVAIVRFPVSDRSPGR